MSENKSKYVAEIRVAAIRVAECGDGQVSIDQYIHQCHQIASALSTPVLAEWREDEFLVDPLKRCPCVKCVDRNPELKKFKHEKNHHHRV
jgi:hypothetical protein